MRLALSTVLLPMEHAAALAAQAWEGAGAYFGSLRQAQVAEDAARELLVRMVARADQADRLAEENARLRALLDLRPALTVASVSAEVPAEAEAPARQPPPAEVPAEAEVPTEAPAPPQPPPARQPPPPAEAAAADMRSLRRHQPRRPRCHHHRQPRHPWRHHRRLPPSPPLPPPPTR